MDALRVESLWRFRFSDRHASSGMNRPTSGVVSAGSFAGIAVPHAVLRDDRPDVGVVSAGSFALNRDRGSVALQASQLGLSMDFESGDLRQG